MTENIINLETVVEGMLSMEAVMPPSRERIRELIGQCRVIETCRITDDEAEKLARRFEERHGVTMTIGSVLTEKEYEPWLDSARVEINPYYWSRYRKLLTQQHFSGQVIATINSVTDRTLGLLENPRKEGPWDRRGMVVGHVQSGKTANYTGLICKAADAGYRLIVIIAGIHNNLRNQTQLRIDEGFVGRDSARLLSKKSEKSIGVGRFDSTRRPVTFTNSVRDFNKVMATGLGISLQQLNEPAVFVIKKNPSTLKNLLEWLQEHSAQGGSNTIDAPMLLIDDEADNASINIKHDKDEVSRINGQIRDLLKMFERSCYVGYTATPFANIFIDPDTDHEMVGEDLFPRHFIVSLDPPTNYFGATRVFLDDADQLIKHIEDNEELLPLKHRKDLQVHSLPQSLKDAVRSFVVARAIRLARGQVGQHCSMLVNASRFTDVQRQIRNEIQNLLDGIQASVRVHGALSAKKALKDKEIAKLHAIWELEYKDAGVKWSVIQNQLHEAAAPINVVEVNSRSSGTLNYVDHEKTGLSVIAVGGFSLSRGLTLEGLMISYFLRNSMMYDTLMQMGRWFGYRPDYDDLCRVWMPEEAEGWYAHITESIEMLRQELRTMEAAGATPEEFGLKVRSHPDTLIVTARNKMGSGERLVVNIGLDNSFVETAALRRDLKGLQANRKAVLKLGERLTDVGYSPSSASKKGGSWLLQGVPLGPVVNFITEFQNHPGSMLTDPGPVRRYIEERADSELAIWDILFAGVSQSDSQSVVDNTLGILINCQRRTAGDGSDSGTVRIKRHRVSSRGIEKIGLTEEEIGRVEKVYRDSEGKGKKSGKAINYPDRIYRSVRQYPLLIIHLLKIDPGKGYKIEHKEPVVAWSISFPKTHLEEKRVEYVVNTTWVRENYYDEVDEEEMGGDNE
jgi:hypothetical protein